MIDLQVRRRGAACRIGVDQPHHHRRRGEELRGRRVGEDVLQLVDVEAPRRRDQLRCADGNIRNRVEAGAVRHRRGMQQVVADLGAIDVGEVVQRHRQQVAVSQHDALRPAGRAAGVEEPGRLVHARFAARRHRPRPEQAAIVAAVDVDEVGAAARARGVDAGRLGLRRDEAQARTRIVEDVGDLACVQPGVDRDRAGTDRPARVQQLDILRAVLHQQADVVARANAHRLQPAGQIEHPGGELPVGQLRAVTLDDRNRTRQPARRAEQGVGEVQGNLRDLRIC